MNVAVVMGGYSDESVISLKSGQLILNNLNKDVYNIHEVHVLKEGWFLVQKDLKFPINKADFSATIEDSKITFDVILNTVHGTPGEDGHLQAYWDLLEIPYAGCNHYQSSLTFNKRDTLSVLSKFNIPIAQSIYLTEGMPITFEEVTSTLGIPFFVKPNQSGSSLGISKVTHENDFQIALDFAFAEDKEILIESFLDGMEVSVGVLNYNGETTVLGVTEIVSHNDFFDYEAKYLGKSEEITPARISDEMMEKVKNMGIKVYESLRMTGFSRAEYIIMNNEPHFIEINTNPGLSEQSIFPQQATYAKIDISQLLESEIKQALLRKPIWHKL
jgi:D-alanine-D-alanine ligase